MTLEHQIKNLEDQGYEANIQHFRYWHDADFNVDYLMTTQEAKDYLESSTIRFTLNPRGGLTRATIHNSDGGIVAWADAKCSKEDNYSRKLGAYIALGRAAKKLKQNLFAKQYDQVVRSGNGWTH